MITFLSLASQKKESSLIREQAANLAARWTEEAWSYEMFEKLAELEHFLEEEPVLDMISWDLTVPGSIRSLERMRRDYRQAFLLVIADVSISPMLYLKPAILPTSLILKPLKAGSLKPVMEEMFRYYSEQFEKNEIPDSFLIETREGKQYIPVSQIYYVEARAKKVYIRTKNEEYGFYGTIENMEKELPDTFCRCHRSYVVNMSRVQMVKASLNVIELSDGIEVPLSRSYKKQIKEYRKDG